MAGRFIKLYEQILRWEWYRYPNTLALFIHLLLRANYCDLDFHGRVIKRGQMVTTLPSLSTGTGLSIQQVRTSLKHLISTGEVTDESSNQYRIITVVKYDEYQSSTGKLTGNQQATNRQVNRQLTDNLTSSIEYIEDIERDRKIDSPTEREGKTAKRFTPPSRKEILSYCQEAGIQIDVDRFIDYYTSNGWMVGKNRMKDFRATIRNWAKRDAMVPAQNARPAQVKEVIAQRYTQRDYENEQEEAVQRMMEAIRNEQRNT